MALLGGCSSLPAKVQSPLARLEQQMIYQPPETSPWAYAMGGTQFEDAHFAAADGTRLHGWYVSHPQPRAVVLYAHGNGENVGNLHELLLDLRDKHQLSVMAFDYRGFGHSEGQPSEAGVLSDARAARTWLAKRTGLLENEIVLMGRSLGGGVMVDLAAHDGARGLILESTFTSLPEVAARQVRWLPVGWIMQNRFDSLAKIGQYQGPLLESHGDADRLIPYEMAQRLFAAAPGPKQFVTIPGGDHNDPQTDEYYKALDEFIGSLPTERPAAVTAEAAQPAERITEKADASVGTWISQAVTGGDCRAYLVPDWGVFDTPRRSLQNLQRQAMLRCKSLFRRSTFVFRKVTALPGMRHGPSFVNQVSARRPRAFRLSQ